MSRFKIEPSPVAGLCGSCRNARVMETQSNRISVICGGGDPVFRVPEPVERCGMFSPKDAPKMAQWMKETAWQPAVIREGRKRLKTFMDPDDERLEEASRDPFASGWNAAAMVSIRKRKIGVNE